MVSGLGEGPVGVSGRREHPATKLTNVRQLTSQNLHGMFPIVPSELVVNTTSNPVSPWLRACIGVRVVPDALTQPFIDRREAGAVLAQQLRHYAAQSNVIG